MLVPHMSRPVSASDFLDISLMLTYIIKKIIDPHQLRQNREINMPVTADQEELNKIYVLPPSS